MCVQERAVTIQILYQNGDCKELCNTLFSIFVFFNKIFMPSQPIFRTHTISPELSLFTTHASLPRGVRQHYYTLATLFSTSKSLCRYIYSYKPVAAITIYNPCKVLFIYLSIGWISPQVLSRQGKLQLNADLFGSQISRPHSVS